MFAFEQAALRGVLCAKTQGRDMGYVGALQFATAYAQPVLYVMVCLMAFTLLAFVPFLVVAGIIYLTLLTEYDINYCLTEQPPVFLFAPGLGAIVVIALTTVIQWLVTGCFLSFILRYRNQQGDWFLKPCLEKAQMSVREGNGVTNPPGAGFGQT